jgi:hypothetical protein
VASTPEGKVKDKVKKMLKAFGPEVYSHWPVQNGMGSPTLDCVGCAFGVYFAIETKVEGKDLTPRQQTTADQMIAAGAVVFVVRNELDVENVRVSVEMLKYANHRKQ